MNIILINHYAGSQKMGMEFRPYYLAKEWVALGHNVTIIAATYSHLRAENIPNHTEKVTKEDGINYYWINTPYYEGNGVKRLKNTAAFSKNLYKESKEINKLFKPDVVIASSPHPFIIFGAKKLSKISGAKIIFEVRDLWPLSMIQLHNLSPYHPFMYLMQKVENYSYKNSDAIASVLPYAEKYYRLHGATGSVGYFPNSIDLKSWNLSIDELDSKLKDKFGEIKDKNHFVVGYVGTIGIANCVDDLIQAAELLKEQNISFVIVGEGDQKSVLQKECRDKKLKNVHFLDRVSKSLVPKILNECDALYIGWKNIDLYQYGVSPNKIMDYMMASKPIIHAISAPRDIVKDYKCGITIEAENPEKLAMGIKSLSTLDIMTLNEMGKNGYYGVVENHDYARVANEYIEFIKTVGV